MPLRAGMVELVGQLRQITAAAHDDEFDGETFWTDEQLQDVLDRNRLFYRNVKLTPRPYKVGGSTQYDEQTFSIPRSVWIENNAVVHNEAGDAFSATLDQSARLITLTDSTTIQLYADLWLYDMNGSAAEVWSTKAAQRFDWVNMRGGNHKFDYNQTPLFCEKQATYYRQRRIKAWNRK